MRGCYLPAIRLLSLKFRANLVGCRLVAVGFQCRFWIVLTVVTLLSCPCESFATDELQIDDADVRKATNALLTLLTFSAIPDSTAEALFRSNVKLFLL